MLEQLVGCIISIRTRDEVSLPAALELFRRAPTPVALAGLSVDQIDRLIHDSSFHRAKAEQIRAIARGAVNEFAGVLPCEADVLTSFESVGPKCSSRPVLEQCAQVGVSTAVVRAERRARSKPRRPPSGSASE